RPSLATRYYERGGNGKDLTKVNRKDSDDDVNGGGGVCYFTASSGNEQAGEDDFDGARHGVFTHFLAPRLTGKRDLWGELQAAVGGKVAEHMEDLQHPRLTTRFVDKVIFDN